MRNLYLIGVLMCLGGAWSQLAANTRTSADEKTPQGAIHADEQVNKAILDDPAAVGADPYGKGWLIKIKMAPGANVNHLLTAEQYEEQIASQGH